MDIKKLFYSIFGLNSDTDNHWLINFYLFFIKSYFFILLLICFFRFLVFLIKITSPFNL